MVAAAEPPKTLIPDLFDPNHRPPKPDPDTVKTIRFLTTDDFPPFHFALADGSLAGFDIDLARAICSDLQLACTIQARRFDTIVGQIKAGKDDAEIAAIANNAQARESLDFTAPYYTTPARFVAKATMKGDEATPSAFRGLSIGVEAKSAHEAFLRLFFKNATIKPYPTQTALREALMKDEIALAFGDGISLAIWLNGTESKSCCRFVGGPFTESHFFGNGVSIGVAKGNVALRMVLDYELSQLVRTGVYGDIYLKYFPIGFY
jgi:polar amino acid transport system substrate-binding protein